MPLLNFQHLISEIKFMANIISDATSGANPAALANAAATGQMVYPRNAPPTSQQFSTPNQGAPTPAQNQNQAAFATNGLNSAGYSTNNGNTNYGVNNPTPTAAQSAYTTYQQNGGTDDMQTFLNNNPTIAGPGSINGMPTAAAGATTATYGRTTGATGSPGTTGAPAGTGTGNGSIPGLTPAQNTEYGAALNTINTPLTVGSELSAEDQLIAGRRSQADDEIATLTQQATNQERVAAQNASAADTAAGLMGTKTAATDVNNATQPIADNLGTQIAGILAGIDTQADSDANLIQQQQQAQATGDITTLNAVAQQQQANQANAQATFAMMSKMPDVDFNAFIQTPQGQTLLQQTGYDPASASLIWNSNQNLSDQIDYSKFAPIDNPDGTTTLIGSDPTKTGPAAIVQTKIDSAPQGFKTVVGAGGLPYWQALNPDGSPNPNGALYPVPSTKSNFITLRDASGTNYLYDTYSGRIINPLGADTIQAGQPGNTTPATPLSSTSTLSQLFGYYTKGDTSYTPGAGYLSAITNSLGLSGDTAISQITPDKLPALADGVMQAEGGANGAAASVHNQGEILWSTAKVYGLDTQFGATQFKAPNGTTYAAFPDDATGKLALQSYLGSLINGSSASQKLTGTTGSPTVDSSTAGYSTAQVGDTQMSQAAIDAAAVYLATTGQMLGGSRSTTGLGGVQSTAIKNRAAEISSGQNYTANKAKLASLSGALSTQTDYQNTIQRSIDTVDSNLQLLTTAADNVNDNNSPLINEWENAAKSGVIGSGDLASYKAAIQTVRSEYSNILARGGTVTDSVRTEASTLIPDNITKSQLLQVIDTLKSEGQNVLSGANTQVQTIQDQINGILGGSGGSSGSDNSGSTSGTTSSGFSYTITP